MTNKSKFYAYIIISISLIGIIAHLDKYGMTNLWGTLVFILLFLVGVTTVMNDIKSKKSNDSNANETLDTKVNEPKNEKQLFLDSLSPSEIKEKVKFYNDCSTELKKWADLRESHSITEEEYKDKKEQGQYVNNALASISFVVELIYNKAIIGDWFTTIRYGNLSLRGYNIPSGHRDLYVKHERKNKQWVDCRKWVPELIFGNPPQIIFKEWLELRKSNAITEEEYQKLKEEFLKVEGVNEGSDTTDEIKAWSSLRDEDGITEKEFQKLKVYLLSKSK